MALGVGPVVYCLEEADNGAVREMKVDTSAEPRFEYEKNLLGGVGTLYYDAIVPDGTVKEVKAIPYFSWANRGKGEMIVWINTK